MYKFSHGFWMFCSGFLWGFWFWVFFFHCLLSLHFTLGSSYCLTSDLTDFSLVYVQLVDEPIRYMLSCFFIYIMSFLFFLRLSISLLIWPIFSCSLSTFSVILLYVLIVVITNDSCLVISISVSYQNLVLMLAFSVQTVFACLLAPFIIFCWKPDMLFWAIRTEINKFWW